MADLKQVAERLRKVESLDKTHDRIELAKVVGQVYGSDGYYSAMMRDERSALNDWLAERDPTPLTAEVLESFGFTQATLTNPRWGLWTSEDGRIAKEMVLEKLAPSFYSHTHSIIIRTVGNLRTLARLAGVELRDSNRSTP